MVRHYCGGAISPGCTAPVATRFLLDRLDAANGFFVHAKCDRALPTPQAALGKHDRLLTLDGPASAAVVAPTLAGRAQRRLLAS